MEAAPQEDESLSFVAVSKAPPPPIVLQEEQELAYLVLDECCCYSGFRIIPSSSSVHNTSPATTINNNNDDDSTIPNNHSIPPPDVLNQWIPVRVIPKQTHPKKEAPPVAPVATAVAVVDDCCCRRCHLILQRNNISIDDHDTTTTSNNNIGDYVYTLDMNQIVPFHGTIHDVVDSTDDGVNSKSCDSCTCTSSSSSSSDDRLLQQRSDASLMLGLLAACHPHVQIVHCHLLLQNTENPNNTDNNNNNVQDENQSCYDGSIIVTLSFPYLSMTTTTTTTTNRRRIVPTTTTTENSQHSVVSAASSKKIKIKPLSPALQLLLTLIRSDWDQYERVKQQLLFPRSSSGSNNIPHQRHQSFFPSTLTLGNMYDRIQQQQPESTTSSSLPCRQNDNVTNSGGCTSASGISSLSKVAEYSGDTTQQPCCWLTLIPFEILHRNIVADYCTASSLASLRATCHHMHFSLRNVVPGLKLQLYHHQIDSLYWMRQRETSQIKIEADCFKYDDNYNRHHPTSSYLNNEATGDIHRAITAGASVKLSTNPAASFTTTSASVALPATTTIYIDPLTGFETLLPDDRSKMHALPRVVACGGLLCDDPGLGKTITVLALILQTLSSPVATNDAGTQRNNKNNDATITSGDEMLFEMYWTEETLHYFRRPYLLKLVNDFCRKVPIGSPFPLRDFRKSIDNDHYGTSFPQFHQAMQKAIDNCQTEEYPDTSHLMSLWDGMVQDFKQGQLCSVRSRFANAKAKPNSRLAALVEEEARKEHLDALSPSQGTLVVVPPVLLEHWKAQINLHIDFRYLTDRIPLIYEYNRKDYYMTVSEATKICRVDNTHAPMVLIDNGGTRPLPSAEFLSMFQIVITTTQRFINEAKMGSFQEQLGRDDSPFHDYHEESCCELLKVHWTRMVVDEGHSMGNDGNNSAITFASWMKAHRRWAMTGTPTKQNATKLGQVRGLMRFLQHDFFTSRLNGDVLWKVQIAKGWNEGDVASFFRLYNLLRFLMRRHTKLNIVEVPFPLFCKSKVETSYAEANTYNTLVSAIQMNLLLTSMNGRTSGFQDSLLHRSQAKSARLALQNIGRVCSGWSRVVPTISSRFYDQTIDMARSFNHSENAIAEVELFMKRAAQEQLSACFCCGIQISTMLLMSCCGGQICTECMDSSTSSCYLCDRHFDVDELQSFQPGFVLDWKSDCDEANFERNLERNSLVYSDEATGSNESVDSPLYRLIRQSQSEERRRTKKVGDGHPCEYDIHSTNGRCIYCLEEHSFCCLLNDASRCRVCYRVAEEIPLEESKTYFLSRRLLEMQAQYPQNFFQRDVSDLSMTMARPLKVIVFSQFRAALNFVGDRLLKRFGTACVAEFFGSHRKEELRKFTYEQSCFCLLLTKDGSEGLDLSFVTNIIFLEEIFDKSLKDQVVARAWRMGASGRVTIETLISKNTIEEVVGVKVLGRNDNGGNFEASSKTVDKQRIKSLLQSLRFITDHQYSFQCPTSRSKLEIEARTDKRTSLKRSLPDAKSDESSPQLSQQKCRTVRFADID